MSLDTAEAGSRRRRYTPVQVVLLLLLLVLLIEGLLVGRHVFALWTHGMRLKALADSPGAVLQAKGPARVKADLVGLGQALRGLRSQLGFVLRPVWLPWPAARENLLTVDELLRIGAELAQAGQVATDGLQSIVDAMQAHRSSAGNKQNQSMSEALLEGLVAARPYFQQAEPQVGRAYTEVAAFTEDKLWSPLARIVFMLEHYLALGRAGLGTAAALPALLGETDSVNYLLVAQNNDELRATGGFVTGIGLLTVKHGKIAQMTIRDSYGFDKFTVDHPFAPEPMQRHMGIILWTTRDGNWSPDFPTAAQAIENLYHLENPEVIQGVVAFDMLAIQALVQAIGPLELPEYPSPITGDNVLQTMRDAWEPQLPEGATWSEWVKQGWHTIKEEWWVHRKDFMEVLAEELMAELEERSQPEQLSALLWAVKRAIEEKHIQMYFHEPAMQELLATGGWDGALEFDTDGDYLLALDTNMGYNKVNLNVKKSVEYEVTLRQGMAPQATLTITYDNLSPVQAECIHKPRIAPTYDRMAQDCYWNYLRIYVPAGSQLLAAEGVTETERLPDEKGKTVFGTFFIVPANESHPVRFTYTLPDWGLDKYELVVQKQAGTDAVPHTVRIVLPAGVRVQSASPKPQARQPGVLQYDLDLREDRFFILKLQ